MRNVQREDYVVSCVCVCCVLVFRSNCTPPPSSNVCVVGPPTCACVCVMQLDINSQHRRGASLCLDFGTPPEAGRKVRQHVLYITTLALREGNTDRMKNDERIYIFDPVGHGQRVLLLLTDGLWRLRPMCAKDKTKKYVKSPW